MKAAFLFPGQGAQKVGMGRDLCESFPVARDIFDRAEEITGLDLKKLCFEGPEEVLSRTDIAQPAIFTVSAAVLAVQDRLAGEQGLEDLQVGYMAGLSLGEYTALYGAGAIDFATGLGLVARRGELMQQAATAVPSGMVSILGLDIDKAVALCEAASEGQILACANFNCPGQVVLSGEIGACRRAEVMAADFGASGAVMLKVAGAFHSEIMKPAAEQFAPVLAGVAFAEPEVPVIANVDARPYAGPARIAEGLVRQLTSPVRWQQSMEYLLADGCKKFYEIGPGRVLAGLMRRIRRKVDFTSLNDRQDLEALAGTHGAGDNGKELDGG